MNIVAYGGGTNSTAMLIECVARGVPVDLILFADTGGERPETYAYITLFSEWLVAHEMPPIVTVYRVDKNGDRLTIEQNCLDRNELPSIVYGFKTCSQKYKTQPVDKFCNNWGPARQIWKSGEKCVKLIGFDAGEPQRAKPFEDKKFIIKYPLIEWDMGREECLASICKAGLPSPGKSACFFCPSSKAGEIKSLSITNPDLMERALAMEANAMPNLTSIKGLGRNWAWKDLVATADMFEDDFLQPLDIACGCYDG